MKKMYAGISGLLVVSGLFYFFLWPENKSAETVEEETVIQRGPLDQLLAEDSAGTMAIAAYPDSIRHAVFTVCEYPEAILKMEELQQVTQTRFRSLTDPLPKENQSGVWNITRYNGLAEKLGGTAPVAKADLEKIAAGYPEDVRADILKCGAENYSTLHAIADLNTQTASSFDSLIITYPAPVQQSFRTLAQYPELVELLGANMRLTVKAGDLHRQDHQKLDHQMDSLNIELARQKTKEVQDWKAGLQNNPEAQKEFEQASTEYKTEHNSSTTTIVNETVVVNYVCYPYSYWYGYPWWWNYPYWYPYPYWYASGYYYGPYGIVYFGYPTPYYTWWYFHHYPHHYHYSHFSDYYIDHYYGHRRTPSASGRVVQKWVEDEKPRVSETFFAKDASRPDRIKELGRAEMDRADYNAQNPGKPVTREEFVQNNAAKYPDLVPKAGAPQTQPGQTPAPPPPVQGKPGNTPQPPQQKTTPKPAPSPKPSVNPPSPKSPAPAPRPPQQKPQPQPPRSRPK